MATHECNVTRRDFLKAAGATAAAGALAGALSGCSGNSGSSSSDSSKKADEPETHTATDMGGTDVEVPTNPTKYADGWYAHNEITIMLSQAEGLVATRS